MNKLLLICISFFMVGCNTFSFFHTKPILPIERPNLELNLEDKGVKLNDNADSIQESVKTIKSITNEPVVSSECDNIVYDVAQIKTIANDLIEDSDSNKQIKVYIADLEKQIEVKNNELQEYENGFKESEKKVWYAIYSLAGLLIVIGVFMAVNGRVNLGSGVGMTGVVLIAVAKFMMVYATYVAIGGGIILLIGICYVIRRLKLMEHATIDVIKTAEIVKKDGWNKDIINTVQSKETKQIVNDIRNQHIKQ